MKNILIVLLLLSANCCKPDDNMHHTISFINNANYKVWVAFSLAYPDTVTDAIGYLDISPQTMRYLDNKSGYEEFIKENTNGKIILFVRDGNFVIVKRYILTLDTLNTLKWTVTYP